MVAVVRAVVVIVPGGVVRHAREQPRERLHGPAIAGVAVRHPCARAVVHLAEVGVVAEPEHDVGVVFADGVEDLVFAAVDAPGLLGPVVHGLVDEEAGAHRGGERRGILAVLPEGLRRHALGVCRLRHLAVDDERVAVGRAGLELGEDRRHGALAVPCGLVAGSFAPRRARRRASSAPRSCPGGRAAPRSRPRAGSQSRPWARPRAWRSPDASGAHSGAVTTARGAHPVTLATSATPRLAQGVAHRLRLCSGGCGARFCVAGRRALFLRRSCSGVRPNQRCVSGFSHR